MNVASNIIANDIVHNVEKYSIHNNIHEDINVNKTNKDNNNINNIENYNTENKNVNKKSKKYSLKKKRSITVGNAPSSIVLKNHSVLKKNKKKDSADTINIINTVENKPKSNLRIFLDDKDKKSRHISNLDSHEIEQIIKKRYDSRNISFNGLRSLHFRVVNEVRRVKHNNLEQENYESESEDEDNNNRDVEKNKERLLDSNNNLITEDEHRKSHSAKSTKSEKKKKSLVQKIYKYVNLVLYYIFLYVFDILKK